MLHYSNARMVVCLMVMMALFLMVGCERKCDDGEERLMKLYSEWKATYVENVGDGRLKVRDPNNDGTTVSEGIAYGMLFSVAMEDRNTFEGLWSFAKSHMNETGLMHWKIDHHDVVSGTGSASDADQDMAYALIKASEKWRNNTYRMDAKVLLSSIKKYDFREDGILLPGDSWGNSAIFNPSYVCPGYTDDFARVTGDHFWYDAQRANFGLLLKVVNDETALFPDWTTLEGGIIPDRSHFGYDAVRVPIRLAQAICSDFDGAKKAYPEEMEMLKSGFSRVLDSVEGDDFPAGLKLDGQPINGYTNLPFLSSYYAMTLVAEKETLTDTICSKLVSDWKADYYGDSLRLWILLIKSGKI